MAKKIYPLKYLVISHVNMIFWGNISDISQNLSLSRTLFGISDINLWKPYRYCATQRSFGHLSYLILALINKVHLYPVIGMRSTALCFSRPSYARQWAILLKSLKLCFGNAFENNFKKQFLRIIFEDFFWCFVEQKFVWECKMFLTYFLCF